MPYPHCDSKIGKAKCEDELILCNFLNAFTYKEALFQYQRSVDMIAYNKVDQKKQTNRFIHSSIFTLLIFHSSYLQNCQDLQQLQTSISSQFRVTVVNLPTPKY